MRLVVAFDGSEGAQAALREASALARECGAEVVVLRVLNPLVDAADVVAPTTKDAMAVVAKREQAALDAAVAASGLDAAHTTALIELSEHGEDIAETINRVATEQHATMIVISSRRAVGAIGTILGSVTRQVLGNAPCPVLVVRK